MQHDSYDRRAILRFSSGVLVGTVTAGCLNNQSSSNRTVTMTDDFGFDPETTTIETGETVRWTNTSEVDHTVTAYEDKIPAGATYFASGGFESERAARNHVTEGLIAPGAEYEHTFEAPGTYEYYCAPHESSGMVGTVQVE